MFKPLEVVGDTAVRITDQKVRGSNPFERAESVSNQEFADKAASHRYSVSNQFDCCS